MEKLSKSPHFVIFLILTKKQPFTQKSDQKATKKRPKNDHFGQKGRLNDHGRIKATHLITLIMTFLDLWKLTQ